MEFEVESFPGETFHGKIAFISPSVEEGTRTFPVEILVDNPNRKLKPGFFAKGAIFTGTDENVMAVPEAAISTLAGVSSVYVIENGIARQKNITLGIRQGNLFELLSGLEGNETLAASNLTQLVTGTQVTTSSGEEVVPPDSQPPAGGANPGTNPQRGRGRGQRRGEGGGQ